MVKNSTFPVLMLVDGHCSVCVSVDGELPETHQHMHDFL